MRAAIDIGSNSIRLAKGDLRLSEITKLADGIASTGALSPAGREATVATLARYAELCKGYEVVAFATEAVRRASDGQEFIAEVKARTGLDVKLVAPETEARMALFGATKPQGEVTVCDLGGGSLEVISSADGVEPEYIKSLPLGVVVVKNMFERGTLAESYRRAVDGAPALVSEFGTLPTRPVVIMGGSACNIAAGIMDLPRYDAKKVNGTTVTAKELDGFMPILMSPKLDTLRPVCARRKDTIAYGGIIIRALLAQLNADRFTVSDTSNLDAAIKGFEF